HPSDAGGERRREPVGAAPSPWHRARPGASTKDEIRLARGDRCSKAWDLLWRMLPVAVERDDDARAVLERGRDARLERGALPAIVWMGQHGRPLPAPPFPGPVGGAVVHKVHDRAGRGAATPADDLGDGGGGLVCGDNDREDLVSAPRHWARFLRERPRRP